jgi:hypothetical protein
MFFFIDVKPVRKKQKHVLVRAMVPKNNEEFLDVVSLRLPSPYQTPFLVTLPPKLHRSPL